MYYKYVCCVWVMYMHGIYVLPEGTRRGQKIPWNLPLQMFVSCYIKAKNWTQASGRVANALDCWTISPSLNAILKRNRVAQTNTILKKQ